MIEVAGRTGVLAYIAYIISTHVVDERRLLDQLARPVQLAITLRPQILLHLAQFAIGGRLRDP